MKKIINKNELKASHLYQYVSLSVNGLANLVMFMPINNGNMKNCEVIVLYSWTLPNISFSDTHFTMGRIY